MTGRPTFTALLDWLEGRLDEERAREVEAQVAVADEETQRTVDWIRGFLQDARRMPLEQPPPEVSERLRAAFVGFHSPEQSAGWTDATLLYDTRAPLGAAGVRSAAAVDGAQLAFDSPLGRFVVEVTPAGPHTVDIQGLVLIAGRDSGVDLAFFERGTLRRAARAGRDGRFEVRGVPEGVDELWITAGPARTRAVLDLLGS